MFLKNTWLQIGEEHHTNHNKKVMYIDNFRTIDSIDTKHCFVRDILKNGTKRFGKASRSQPCCGLASDKKVDLLWRFSNEIIKCKPDVLRGEECGSENLNYVVVGIRPETIIHKELHNMFSTKTLRKNNVLFWSSSAWRL
mmetsp:Transcript_24936/g.53108  ORF Transcript_24936/g.53108 Transcript_24936/m.53108 type:complete len:140 (+) Transcript_24936:131-550(+)